MYLLGEERGLLTGDHDQVNDPLRESTGAVFAPVFF